MKNVIIMLLIAIICCACATNSLLLVHPKTGQTMDCSSSGMGLAGIILSKNMTNECEKRYRALGYVTTEEYQMIKNNPNTSLNSLDTYPKKD